MMQGKEGKKNVEIFPETQENSLEILEHRTCPPQNDFGFLIRELEFMRREKELMQREINLMHKENELLRATPRFDIAAATSKVTLKSKSDYLCEFNRTGDTFQIWEKEIRKLRIMYDLDDNTTKLLIGAKVKDKAATWLHSKAELLH